MIEINLHKLERGTREGWIDVRRGGKIFRRRQRLGQKEVPSSLKDVTPPNPEIMAAVKDANNAYEECDDFTGGFTSVNEKTGEFTYSHGRYTNWSGPNTGKQTAEPVNFRVEGNTIIREDDNIQVTVPESEISKVKNYYRSNSPKWISLLDDQWGDDIAKRNYINFINNPEEYDKKLDDIDNSSMGYIRVHEAGNVKYSERMDLKAAAHPYPVTDLWVANMWYRGDGVDTSLVGEAVQEVLKGRYNRDNVVQQQIPLMIKAARKINELYGEDTIYRGETNTETAQDILEQLDEFGDVDIADKLFSCTESEKLAKWYASTHTQSTARGRESRSHVMLKISREKFNNNVIMDYRSTGSRSTPEEEVTIVGNDITLTGDDVMVQAVTPKRKTKKWMTFTQFKAEGGLTVDLINEMVQL